jgi:hypothetical protein
MSTCYACDEPATGTCDRAHHHEVAVVGACERHRDDHDERPSDQLLKELVVGYRLDRFRGHRDMRPGFARDQAGRAIDDAACEAENYSGLSGAWQLALALELLDQAGLSAELQEKLCRLLAREMGL